MRYSLAYLFFLFGFAETDELSVPTFAKEKESAPTLFGRKKERGKKVGWKLLDLSGTLSRKPSKKITVFCKDPVLK